MSYFATRMCLFLVLAASVATCIGGSPGVTDALPRISLEKRAEIRNLLVKISSKWKPMLAHLDKFDQIDQPISDFLYPEHPEVVAEGPSYAELMKKKKEARRSLNKKMGQDMNEFSLAVAQLEKETRGFNSKLRAKIDTLIDLRDRAFNYINAFHNYGIVQEISLTPSAETARASLKAKIEAENAVDAAQKKFNERRDSMVLTITLNEINKLLVQE